MIVSNEETAEAFRKGAEKFYNEARLIARFNGNPGIVGVHDFFYENATVYFTMEYLNGQTLRNYIAGHGVLSEEQAVFLAEGIHGAYDRSQRQCASQRYFARQYHALCRRKYKAH